MFLRPLDRQTGPICALPPEHPPDSSYMSRYISTSLQVIVPVDVGRQYLRIARYRVFHGCYQYTLIEYVSTE